MTDWSEWNLVTSFPTKTKSDPILEGIEVGTFFHLSRNQLLVVSSCGSWQQSTSINCTNVTNVTSGPGPYLIISSGSSVLEVDAHPSREFTSRVVATGTASDTFWDAAVDPSGQYAVTGNQSCELKVYSYPQWTRLFSYPRSASVALRRTRFSPDGRYLVHSDWSSPLHLTKISDSTERWSHVATRPFRNGHHDCAVAFSESGRQMAVGSETCVYVWDITNVDNVNHGATTPTIAGAFEQPDSETNYFSVVFLDEDTVAAARRYFVDILRVRGGRVGHIDLRLHVVEGGRLRISMAFDRTTGILAVSEEGSVLLFARKTV